MTPPVATPPALASGRSVQPILPVPDVSKAIAYYCDTLGFGAAWNVGTPPMHGGASFGRAAVQFSLDPDTACRCAGLSYFFFTDAESATALDALCEAMSARGAEIATLPTDFAWGLREFAVQDCHGYRLRFAGPVSHQPSTDATPPLEVRIIARRPTPEEYARLIRSAGWEHLTPLHRVEELLAPVMHTIVAEHASTGNAVGCALLLHDGVSVGYVKDVIVLPEWQKRSIGSAMMRELVAWAEANLPPTALLTLFTGKPLAPFYERFGFLTPADGLLGMSRRVGR